uniref:Ribosomal protein S11 n=1 Tax=Nelumbo nucifera TaxID=4432 RepID=A0A822XXT3_NELNU|nr:TPA_asm: hypothetical protein HUJ06_023661 [Nelumbo nucifera]
MAKPIPRIGSCKNGRIGLRKSGCRIPKGVIHVQESFYNTIVTVTDVRGRVVSWPSAGTCGFRGMQRAEVMIKGLGLERDATLQAIHRSGLQLSIKRQCRSLPCWQASTNAIQYRW